MVDRRKLLKYLKSTSSMKNSPIAGDSGKHIDNKGNICWLLLTQDTLLIDGARHSKHDAIPNFLGLL